MKGSRLKGLNTYKSGNRPSHTLDTAHATVQAVSATEREELFAEHRRDTEKREKEAKRARRAARTAAFRELLASFKGIRVMSRTRCA